MQYLTFSLSFLLQIEYDFAASLLTVNIIKCEDLVSVIIKLTIHESNGFVIPILPNKAAMDLGGLSDPYVKIYLLPDKKRKQETR